MKQIKLWLTTIAVLLCSITASAYDFEVDGFCYEVNLEEMTATLVAVDKTIEGHISIPQTVVYKDREFTITAIEGAFTNNKLISSVEIPNTIMILGEDAFSGCTSLSEITGMEGISKIGSYCFSGCTSLQEIILPNNVTSIGICAFQSCSSLTSIEIPNSVTSIGQAAFSNCINLPIINLPSKLTSISANLFAGCQSLVKINFPTQIKTIWDFAFGNCVALNEITITENVESIRNSAFSGCTNLKTINILNGSSILELGYNRVENDYYYPMFEDCPIETIFIGRNIKSNSRDRSYNRLGCFANNKSIRTVVFGDNVTSIEQSAFEGCTSLNSIIIPRNITSIGDWAFYNSGLKDLVFESGSEVLKFELEVGSWDYKTPHTFQNCNISSISLGRNIVISGGAQNPSYGGNPSTFFPTTLKSLMIGDQVHNLDCILLSSQKITSSLQHYPDLETIRFGANCATIPDLKNNNMLSNLSTTSTIPPTVAPFSDSQYMDLIVEVPSGAKTAYEGAVIWKNFWELRENDTLFTNIEYDGLLYQIMPENSLEVIKKKQSYTGDIIIPKNIIFNNTEYTVTSIGESFSVCKELTSVSIPTSVVELSNKCFYGCVNLSNVDIQGSVSLIPISAFQYCKKLTELNLPSSINSIENSAFMGCSSLTSFNSPSCLTRIGNSAFQDCNLLNEVSFSDSLNSIGNSAFKGCVGLSAIQIPNGIVAINDSTFYGCSSLSQITNINQISSVGNSSFENCTSLESMEFENLQSIFNSAFKNCSALTNIDLGNKLTSLGDYAMANCSRLTKMEIPGSVINFGQSVFTGCSGLKKLTFEDSDNPLILPTGIYDTATGIQKKSVNGKTIQFKIQYYKPYFYGLPIEKLYLGRNLSKDSRYTISGDGGVDYYIITSYDAPFGNLSKLKELTIGENVNVLGPEQEYISEVDLYVTPGSFKNCSSIQSVDVKNPTPPSGAEFSTTVYNNAKLHVPDNTYSLYSCTDGWKEFVNMIIAPNAIVLDKETITMNVGDICKISATVYPENTTDKTITWISSDDSVVKVSNSGEVTGVSEGKATITASCGNVSASCEVKVEVENFIKTQPTAGHLQVELNTAEEGVKYQWYQLVDGTIYSKEIVPTSSGKYAWTDSNGVWTSGNHGNYQNESIMTATVNLQEGDSISFDYTLPAKDRNHSSSQWFAFYVNENLKMIDFGSYDGECSYKYKERVPLSWLNGIVSTLKFECVRENSDCATVSNIKHTRPTGFGNGKVEVVIAGATSAILDESLFEKGWIVYCVVTLPNGKILISDKVDTGTTNVENVNLDIEKSEVYNLQGLRIIDKEGLPRGVYIINGKKTFVK